MQYQLPLTIDNGHGESVTFTKIVTEADGDKLFFEGRIQPGVGPVQHIHILQDEYFEVVKGQLTYQIEDQEPEVLLPGEHAILPKNVAHKFWNSGAEELVFNGWVQPAHNFLFFLTTLFAATKHQKTAEPAPFDGAFLITRYASEFELLDLPLFVRRIVIPLTYQVGRLLGKYRKFEHAPLPV